MNNIASTTTLWQLLGKSDIVVPILQRDYAQGRSGYENLREKFLSSILDALDNKQQLKLDFVYGSSDFSGRFNPIDGQQRLTTLWLIHWFLAFKLGKLQDESVIQRLLHFSYETRSSSTQFCNLIVRRGGELHQMDNENIADTIIRQTWFPSVWRQDPTVQAMLRMLSGELNGKVDGIEEAERESARAGTSQHQAGCAIDFGNIEDSFINTKEGLWLSENAHKYGWSLSFPKGYEDVTGYRWECWHYRYLGKTFLEIQQKWFNNIQQFALEFFDIWKNL